MQKQNIDFEKEFDIVVCGAGIAGVAAAVSAAETGKKVALIEKTFTPGGLAVSGFINIFLPLCDGCGNQVIFGMAERLLKLSLHYSPFKLPPGWGGEPGKKISRYAVKFSPGAFALALENLLVNSGVEILYDSLVCDAELQNHSKINSVSVENISGRGKIYADYFIDATGNAYLAEKLGLKTLSYLNLLSSWNLQSSLSKATSASKFNDPEILVDILKLGEPVRNFDKSYDSYTIINNKFTHEKITNFVIFGRNQIREYYETQNNSDSFPLALANMPHMRLIRTVKGSDEVKNDPSVIPEKIVGRLPDWRTPGTVYNIPLGALLSEKVSNLILAGRIISTEYGNASEIIRVIPSAAFTGETAGRIAVYSILKNKQPSELTNENISELNKL
jgi:hypothetical protein